MKSVLFKINDEDCLKVDFLKGIAKTKARSKVFIYCLNKTYDQFKDVKP